MTEQDLKDIAGGWNGDEAGRDEDRATLALEILGKIEELKEM